MDGNPIGRWLGSMLQLSHQRMKEKRSIGRQYTKRESRLSFSIIGAAVFIGGLFT